jgi:S-adenosylmethionine:tRNA ribosyltransferase-isomerase
MHPERYSVPQATADAVVSARERGRKVLAIGTTVVRALESAADESGRVRAGEGSTALFIYPPYRFHAVDALLTNFHLPRSTLLALVMAFGGVAEVRNAYRAAVEGGYRFYSYGDAMLIGGAA